MTEAESDIWRARLGHEELARKDAEARLEETTRELCRCTEELEEKQRELDLANSCADRALETAAGAHQSKSQFLASVSHELRTPLNAIIGFAEILKSGTFGPIGNERYQNYAALIHQSGSHLLGLVNDILDISKLDAGKLELYEDVLDLGAVIADCVSLIEPQAQKTNVAVTSDVAFGAIYLKADERRLRQVLLNLLSNAVKFTPDGGKVTVSATVSDESIVVSVADTGIGIAPEHIQIALERFGQIDSPLSRKYEGTGLGLPLAKQLVERHGGRLAIASEVGVGTTVSIVLPGSRLISGLNAA